MIPMTGDPALYRHDRVEPDGSRECDGTIGTYVDDLLCSGTDEFIMRTKKLRRVIELKEPKESPFVFAGIRVEQGAGFNVTLDQREYINKLELLKKTATFDQFRSTRHKLAWIAGTRPDILAASNIYSQVTQESFTTEHIKNMNKSIKYLKDSADQHLTYNPMDMDKCKIVAFADGSHASNADQTSQIGYLVFVTDGCEWHLLQYKSNKSRRVVRSPLAAEVHALAEAADTAIMTQHDLRYLLGRKLRIRLLTDSKSLFDVLSKGSSMSEKRLMIDIKATKDAYDNDVINELGCIRRDHNLADAMTKNHVNGAMRRFMATGEVHYEAEQFVVREPRYINDYN